MGFNAFGFDIGHMVQKAPEHSKSFRRKVKLHRSGIMLGTTYSNNMTMTSMTANTRPFIHGQQHSKSNHSTTNHHCGSTTNNNNTITNKRSIGGKVVSLETIRQNKAFTKLLVLAKREKIKEELKRNQERLTFAIWNMLLAKEQKLGNGEEDISLLLSTTSDMTHHTDSNDNIRKRHGKMTIQNLMNQLGKTDGTWPSDVDARVHIHHLILGNCQNHKQQKEHFLDNNHHYKDQQQHQMMKNATTVHDGSGKSDVRKHHTHHNSFLSTSSEMHKFQIVCTLPKTMHRAAATVATNNVDAQTSCDNMEEEETNENDDNVSNANKPRRTIINGVIIQDEDDYDDYGNQNDHSFSNMTSTNVLLAEDGIISPNVSLHVERL